MEVVDAQYVEPYVVDLSVQKKSGVNPKNGNFTVVDVNGNVMFKIADTRFSFHDRHILYDVTDKPVLTFKKKLRSIHGRWQAFKGESTTHKDKLFSVKKSSAPKHETELDVFLVENKEETVCDCKVMGNWETKSCTIYAQDGSTILAEVHAMQNNTSVVLEKGTFGITIYPDVDYVFIVSLVVIVIEIKSYDGSGKKKKKKKKEKKKKHSESSEDDHEKDKEKKDDEKEGEEHLEEKSEEHHDDREEEEDDDDDYSEEDDDYDDDEDDDGYDYDDEKYDEEPKYDEYDDDDDEESSSSSDEDESPKEK